MAMATGDNPFAGKGAVKVIAVIDIFFAALLICFYTVKWITYDGEDDKIILPKGPADMDEVFFSIVGDNLMPVWITLIAFHATQLIMGFILLSAVYDKDAEESLGKCQMWWCTAIMLFILLMIEASVVSYMTFVQNSEPQPISLGVFAAKVLFRFVAVLVVRRLMRNLKKAPPSSVHQKVYIRSKTIGPPPSNYIRY